MHQVPVKLVRDRDSNGRPFAPGSDFAQLGFARTGYQISFGDRRALLQIMYDGVKNKSKILMDKKVADVIHSADGVTVKCEDGTTYEGDVLVGADGVYSKTREVLWDLAAKDHPEKVKKDREALTAEYQCLFGICSKVDGVNIGDGDYGYDQDRSSLVVVCKGGRTYYFIFQKMEKVYRGLEFPRYSKSEVEEFAKAHFDMKIRPNVTFKALWEKNIASNLVVLEEGTFDVWTHGRIACVGDSVHKMTPNVGYGGNAAIESAAALANVIKKMADKADEGHLIEGQIEKHLSSYQESRKQRADAVVKVSADVTRLQSLQLGAHRAFVRYALPYTGDFLANMQADMVIGAANLSFLPLPRRSATASMPYNPTQGEGQKESKLKRLALALPFLVLFFLAKPLMDPAPLIPWATSILQTKTLPWTDTPLTTSFYGLMWLDNLLAPIVVFFSPVLSDIDAVSKQAFLFLVDYGVILAIWLIESARRANTFTPAQLPLLFTLSSQFLGVGVISPLYYLLHYILSPIEAFKASDMRLTRIAYTKSILPTLILVYYLPLYFSFFTPSLADRISWNFLWQLFPVWTSLIASQFLFRLSKDTTKTDRIDAVTRDLPVIRTTIGLLVFQSAVVWLYTLYKASFSYQTVLDIVLPPMHSPQDAPDLITFAGEFLRFDSAFLFGNTFLWLGYLFWDIKHAGMLSVGWARIVGYAVAGVVLLGPGAAAGLGFLWREELLATRRHWGAVTEEKASEWNRKLGVKWAEGKGEGMVSIKTGVKVNGNVSREK